MTKKILSIICALLLVLALGIHAFADFGDFGGDSDYGGGFDFGDSDYDYDYDDYDYDYDDDDDDYYDYDDDDDYEEYVPAAYYHLIGFTQGVSQRGGVALVDRSGKSLNVVPVTDLNAVKDDSGTGVVGAAFLAAVAAIIAVVVIRRNKAKVPYVANGGATPTRAADLKPVSEYKLLDPEFSESELCTKISNLYVQFQNGWQNKSLDELRPYMTDEFFGRMDRQLDAYRRNGQTNMIERISVLGVTVTGWSQQNGEDFMIASVKTRIVDYVINDKTGAVVRGSQTAEKFMEYEWTLSRKTGVKTGVDSGMKSISCPHCGAPMNINKTARCEYCDSIVTVDSTDWAVSDMKGISQRTSGR